MDKKSKRRFAITRWKGLGEQGGESQTALPGQQQKLGEGGVESVDNMLLEIYTVINVSLVIDGH